MSETEVSSTSEDGRTQSSPCLQPLLRLKLCSHFSQRDSELVAQVDDLQLQVLLLGCRFFFARIEVDLNAVVLFSNCTKMDICGNKSLLILDVVNVFSELLAERIDLSLKLPVG